MLVRVLRGRASECAQLDKAAGCRPLSLLRRKLRVVADAVMSQDMRFSAGRWHSETVGMLPRASGRASDVRTGL